VKQARDLAFSPVVGQGMAGNTDFLELFTKNKKDAAVNKQVTGLEDTWSRHAKDNYERARTLAQQALAQVR